MRHTRLPSGLYAAEIELPQPRGARHYMQPMHGSMGRLGVAGGVVVAPWYLTTGVAAGDVEAAYQMKGVASLAASYVNLNSPGTHDLFTGTAPTWDATNGQIYNGSSQYLKTDILPDENQGWSMFLRYSNASGNANMVGMYQDAPTGMGFALQSYAAGDKLYYYNGTFSALSVAPNLTGAVIGFAGATAYRNGVAEAGSIPAAGTPGTSITALYIGGFDYNNGTAVFFSAFYAQAWVIYNKVLNGTQAAAISAAMAAL